MIKFYLISSLVAWISVIAWVATLDADIEKLGIKSKTKDTTGQQIATLVKLIFLMSIPVFNIILPIYAWFKYDDVLNEKIERREIVHG